MYEQLKEILNKCIEKGWKPRGKDMKKVYVMTEKFIVFVTHEDDELIGTQDFEYHSLFSKDSGLMEFVEWKEYKQEEYHRIDTPKEYWFSNEWQWHAIIMCTMSSEEKIQYFINNIKIGTSNTN